MPARGRARTSAGAKPLTRATGTGSVFVINATCFQATLLLNNQSLPSLSGTSERYKYRPYQMLVGRISETYPSTPFFGRNNVLSVGFPNVGSREYPIEIVPAKYPLDRDLQLFLFNGAIVLSYQGIRIQATLHASDIRLSSEKRITRRDANP